MKKLISMVLVLATMVSCIAFAGIQVSAVVSDEGILPFEDVKSGQWFADAAVFCYVNEVINGMDEYTFLPNGKLTRAQFVTMLANLEGVNLKNYSVNKFTDVKSTHWYYGAVAWAYQNGIVAGTSDTKFSPNMQINRETLSRIMMLYMQKKGYVVTVDQNALNKYTDRSSVSSWAVDGMKYMVCAGLISGMTDTTVGPRGVVTRAQAARILMLYMQTYLFAGHTHSFAKADCENSASCNICGMKNGLPVGHNLPNSYNCKTGANCTVCGKYVAPSGLRHDFAAATCGKPATCKICGAAKGKPTGVHSWWAATCTNPKMCKVCYTTEGKALGHTTNNGKCTRCGAVNFVSGYDKVVYYLKENGKYTPSDGVYYTTKMYTTLNTKEKYSVSVNYDSINDYVWISSLYYFNNGDSDFISVNINKGVNAYDFTYMYRHNEEFTFVGKGSLYPKTYTKNTVENYDYADGTVTQTMSGNLNTGLRTVIYGVDELLYNLYGGQIEDLGFTAFFN